jgi:AAA domain
MNIPEQLQDAIPAITEEEVIETVKYWVDQDQEVEASEQRSSEEMLESLKEAVINRPPRSPISDERLREIVATYAPNAPHRVEAVIERQAQKIEGKTVFPYAPTVEPPPELAKLVASGLAYCEYEHWWVKRCNKCGNFRIGECCGAPTSAVSAVRHGEQVLTAFGRQAAGLDPIRPPKPPMTPEQIVKSWAESPWWSSFSGVDEMADGGVKMYIENFIPEGITLLCGLPKEGKTWLALSIAKALTSGQALFGRPGFEVPEAIPVLYLAAEVSDRAFKQRCRKLGITTDKTKFLCRTISKGPGLNLNHPHIEDAVRVLKPIVILDTTVRFNPGEDEDAATENQKLFDAILSLMAMGARAVIGIHHSRKDLKEGEPTMEKAVRGSGDMSAMCDAIWAVIRDERLYQNNKGPNEVDIIGWPRDFSAVPMRLALTRKAPKNLPKSVITFAPGLISCLDEAGDLEWVDEAAKIEVEKTIADKLERLVQEDPKLTLRKLAETVTSTYSVVRNALKDRGWVKGKGHNGLWAKRDTTVKEAA